MKRWFFVVAGGLMTVVGLLLAYRWLADPARLAAAASRALQHGDYETAFAKLCQAAAKRPAVAEYHLGAGMTAAKLGKLDVAEKHYQVAAQLLAKEAETNPARVNDRALALALLGDREGAKAAVAAGTRKFPHDVALQQFADNSERILAEIAQEFGVTGSGLRQAAELRDDAPTR